jgi:hypothetical protein
VYKLFLRFEFEKYNGPSMKTMVMPLSAALQEPIADIGATRDRISLEKSILQFGIELLGLVEDRLPEVAKDGLDAARRLEAGQADRASIREARIKCWEYIQRDHKGDADTEPQVSATRAVICVLDSEQEVRPGNFIDLVFLMLEFVNNVHPSEAEEERLVRKHLCDH